MELLDGKGVDFFTADGVSLEMAVCRGLKAMLNPAGFTFPALRGAEVAVFEGIFGWLEAVEEATFAFDNKDVFPEAEEVPFASPPSQLGGGKSPYKSIPQCTMEEVELVGSTSRMLPSPVNKTYSNAPLEKYLQFQTYCDSPS